MQHILKSKERQRATQGQKRKNVQHFPLKHQQSKKSHKLCKLSTYSLFFKWKNLQYTKCQHSILTQFPKNRTKIK